jgi:hypothetical protein
MPRIRASIRFGSGRGPRPVRRSATRADVHPEVRPLALSRSPVVSVSASSAVTTSSLIRVFAFVGPSTGVLIMGDELVGIVERQLHRKVFAFMSQNHIDPDLAVEVFVLEAADAI